MLFKLIPTICAIATLWGAVRPGAMAGLYAAAWGVIAVLGLAASIVIVVLFAGWNELLRELQSRSTRWWNLCVITLTVAGLLVGQSVSLRASSRQTSSLSPMNFAPKTARLPNGRSRLDRSDTTRSATSVGSSTSWATASTPLEW